MLFFTRASQFVLFAIHTVLSECVARTAKSTQGHCSPLYHTACRTMILRYNKTMAKMTPQGYEKLKHELRELEEQERPAVTRLLKEAISQGDLSENAAYDEAKRRQALIETRIREIKEELTHADIKEVSTSDTVQVGSEIMVKSAAGGEQAFTITGQADANPAEGKISYDSPMGAAFMGRKKGDNVQVETPAGNRSFTIFKIQ
jgi:transcription elongation factor GreA